MTRTVRFNSPAIRPFAIRNLDEIVPGHRYLAVHKQSTDEMVYDHYTGKYEYVSAPDYCEVILITGTVLKTLGVSAGKFDVCFVKPATPNRIDRRDAGDMGIWNAPRAYCNRVNYLVDLNVLDALGITVDTSRSAR